MQRWERIRGERFTGSRCYGGMKREDIPKYLEMGWRESRWKRIVRYRLGNEMREGRYWKEEKGCIGCVGWR